MAAVIVILMKHIHRKHYKLGSIEIVSNSKIPSFYRQDNKEIRIKEKSLLNIWYGNPNL